MPEFKISYDQSADVLYTYIDQPEEAHCVDDGAGLLLRTSLKTGKPCGVTVLDLKGMYSVLAADALCFNIQHFLQVIPLHVIEEKIMYGLLKYKRGP